MTFTHKYRQNRGRNNKTRKNLNKIILIFDLDNTLIHAEDKNKSYNINIRPYFCKLFKYLYKNRHKYIVGFWSSGIDWYVDTVIDTLMKPFGDWDFIIKFARHHDKNNKTYNIIDLHTGRTYSYHNDMIVKNIEFLYTHKDFKYKFCNKKIILVDDLVNNIKINNKDNTYHIKSWKSNMCDDEELLILYRKLKGIDKIINCQQHVNKENINCDISVKENNFYSIDKCTFNPIICH